MDKYQGFANISSQAERWVASTLDDNADLPNVPKGLYFKAAGNVALMGNDGHVEVFNVAAGQTLDLRPLRIMATGTDIAAANIILLLD